MLHVSVFWAKEYVHWGQFWEKIQSSRTCCSRLHPSFLRLIVVTDDCPVCDGLPAPTSPAGPLNMCLISAPLQCELWVFAFPLCIPHMPALSILVVMGEDASHWFCFFIFHCHGISTVAKGRRVECGSHCQMILILKGIKKAWVQISRGRIFSDVLNWGG